MKAYVDNPAATAKALHGVEGELEEGMVGEQRGLALNRQITLARSLAQLTNAPRCRQQPDDSAPPS
eukprot:COSAG01_NODE_2871_length_6942_cov_5.905012_2_plen_66_part_00